MRQSFFIYTTSTAWMLGNSLSPLEPRTLFSRRIATEGFANFARTGFVGHRNLTIGYIIICSPCEGHIAAHMDGWPWRKSRLGNARRLLVPIFPGDWTILEREVSPT